MKAQCKFKDKWFRRTAIQPKRKTKDLQEFRNVQFWQLCVTETLKWMWPTMMNGEIVTSAPSGRLFKCRHRLQRRYKHSECILSKPRLWKRDWWSSHLIAVPFETGLIFFNNNCHEAFKDLKNCGSHCISVRGGNLDMQQRTLRGRYPLIVVWENVYLNMVLRRGCKPSAFTWMHYDL